MQTPTSPDSVPPNAWFSMTPAVQAVCPAEVDAVLAHELGHFKHRHIIKRIVSMFALSLAGLCAARVVVRPGVVLYGPGRATEPAAGAPNDALALLLFMLVVPVFSQFIAPLFAQISRKPRVRSRCIRGGTDQLHRPVDCGLAQVVRGQRLNLDTRPGVCQVLLFTPARHRTTGAHGGLNPCGRHHEQHDQARSTGQHGETAGADGDGDRQPAGETGGLDAAAAKGRPWPSRRPTTFANYYQTMAFVNALAFVGACAGPPSGALKVSLQPLCRALQHPRRRRHLGHRLRVRCRRRRVVPHDLQQPGGRLSRVGAQPQPGLIVANHGRHFLVETAVLVNASSVIREARKARASLVTASCGKPRETRGRSNASSHGATSSIRRDEIRTKSFAANLDQVLILIAAEPAFSNNQLVARTDCRRGARASNP
jgi:hypothetical protein